MQFTRKRERSVLPTLPIVSEDFVMVGSGESQEIAHKVVLVDTQRLYTAHGLLITAKAIAEAYRMSGYTVMEVTNK